MRILVTNIGRRIYFAKFLIDLKKKIKNCKIYLADDNLSISALKIKGVISLKIPKVKDGNKIYLREVKKIIKNKKISLLIPCTNYDLNILSLNIKKIEKIGCHLMVSRNDLIKKCLDKKKTLRYEYKIQFLFSKIF